MAKATAETAGRSKERALRVIMRNPDGGNALLVDVPRARYHGRKRLRWLTLPRQEGEAIRVARAMEKLTADAGQGTKVRLKDFKILDVRTVNGREKSAKKLRRGPFGWKRGTFWLGAGSIKYELKDERKFADKDVRRIVKRTRVDQAVEIGGKKKRLKGNPAEVAIKREEAVRAALTKVDDKYKVDRRATWIAKIAEADPLKFQGDFALGKTPGEIGNNLYYMMLNLGDWQLDPADKIQGPLQGILDQVGRLQEHPILGSAFANLFGKHQERVDRIIAQATRVNKYTSRDLRRPPARLARMATFDWWYTNFRQGEVIQHLGQGFKVAKMVGETLVKRKGVGELPQRVSAMLSSEPKTRSGIGARVRRTTLPAESVVEEARDIRTNQGNLVGFSFVDRLLSAKPNEMRSNLDLYHQRILAEQFILKYNHLSPFDARMQRITDTITKGLHGLIDAGDIAGELKARAKTAVDEAIKAATDGALQDRGGNVMSALRRGASTLMGGARKPDGGESEPTFVSTKLQVTRILESADEVLRSTTLKPVDRIRWEEALHTAREFNAAYRRALEITGQTEQTAPVKASSRRVRPATA